MWNEHDEFPCIRITICFLYVEWTMYKLLFLYKETRHVHSTYRKQIVILIQGNSSWSFHIQETNCYSYTRKLIMFIPHTGNKLPCYRYTGGTTANPSLTISSVTQDDQSQYICQAINSVGTGTSNQVYLTVTGGTFIILYFCFRLKMKI
jgi:hypothetical protein